MSLKVQLRFQKFCREPESAPAQSRRRKGSSHEPQAGRQELTQTTAFSLLISQHSVFSSGQADCWWLWNGADGRYSHEANWLRQRVAALHPRVHLSRHVKSLLRLLHEGEARAQTAIHRANPPAPSPQSQPKCTCSCCVLAGIRRHELCGKIYAWETGLFETPSRLLHLHHQHCTQQ